MTRRALAAWWCPALVAFALSTAAQAAQAEDPGATDIAPAGPTSAAAPDHWGLLGQVAGKFYWYQIAGADPHAAYLKAAWVAPEQTLSVSVHTKAGLVQLAEYQFDTASGKLLMAGVFGSTTWYATAQAPASGKAWYVFGYQNGAPVTTTFRVQPDGSIQQDERQFKTGAWRPAGGALLVEATPDELRDVGLMKKKR